MVIVRGPRENREALVAQAYAEHPEEAERDGVLFISEDVLTGDDEQVAAALLAIQREVAAGQVARNADTELRRMRREAWRQAGL